MKIKFNQNILGDSDEIIDFLIEQNIKVDLILTDPPYNIGKDFGNNSDKLSFDNFLKITEKRIEKYEKILNKNGSIIWFGIHDYIPFIHVIMFNKGLFYRRMNIWHYENGFSRNTKTPLTQYEPFLWFSKSDKKWTYNVDDIRVPYKSTERLKSPVKYKGKNGEIKEWKPNDKGAMRGDVWKYPTLAGKAFEKERTTHPTQKPESLIKEIIKALCPKNEMNQYEGIILDPFHGSGTVGVCCEKLNLEGNKIKWLGIELEEKWKLISDERVKKVYE